jgi:hypothetical protein
MIDAGHSSSIIHGVMAMTVADLMASVGQAAGAGGTGSISAT